MAKTLLHVIHSTQFVPGDIKPLQIYLTAVYDTNGKITQETYERNFCCIPESVRKCAACGRYEGSKTVNSGNDTLTQHDYYSPVYDQKEADK